MKRVILIIINFLPLLIYLETEKLLAQNTQYDVHGYVYDLNDNEPLIGVNVYIEELKIGTSTDSKGEFIFNNIKNGNYTLRFSYVGHKTEIKKITVPLNEQLIIKLEDGTIDLKEVIVTGNPLSLDPKELSQSALTISNLDLQINKSSTVAQTLNFQPGISIRSNGVATSRPVIRGFSNNRVLILENGLRMGDLSNTSDDHAVSNDGSTSEKIEILRGPSSLLYGNNAIGGVINIITEEIPSYIPSTIDGILIGGVSSNNKEIFGSGDIHIGFNKFAIHSNYFNRTSQDYHDGFNTVVKNTDQFSRGYQFGFSYIPSSMITGLSYKDYSNNYGIPLKNEDDEPIKIEMRKREIKFLLNSSKSFYWIKNFSLKGGYQNYKHQEIIRSSGEIGTSFGLKSFVLDFSMNHTSFPLANSATTNNQGVFGIWFQSQQYTIDGEEAFTPNANYYSFAAYLLEQIKLNKFILQIGGRYERNKVEIPESVISETYFPNKEKIFNTFSGSLGFTYKLTETISSFFNIANAFRSPTIEELSSYAIHEATGSFDIGNINLKTENNLGFDFGFRVQQTNHTIELSSYYNLFDNYIFRSRTNKFYNPASEEKFNYNDGYPVYEYTQRNAVIYGFELKSQLEFTNLFSHAGSFSVTIISDYTRGKMKETKENLPEMPPLRFSIEARYTSDYFWIGLKWKLAAQQNFIGTNETITKGYGLVDFYGGIKILTGELIHIIDIKAENIFNQPYKDHLSSIKNFAFMPGRNIQVSYKFLF